MTRRSSISIGYKDLLQWARTQRSYALQRKSSSIGRGVTNQEALSHDVACAEQVVRMLERCEPGKQANMYELFQQTNK